jgi:hypothetical protein
MADIYQTINEAASQLRNFLQELEDDSEPVLELYISSLSLSKTMPKLQETLFELAFHGEDMTPERFEGWLLLSGLPLPNALYAHSLETAISYGIDEDSYRAMMREGDHRGALFPGDVPSIISYFHRVLNLSVARLRPKKNKRVDVAVAALTYMVDVWNSELTTEDDFIELAYPKIGTLFDDTLMRHDNWTYAIRSGTHVAEVLLPGIPSLDLLPVVYLQDFD